ncbi:MAG: GntR family transcriptional regulator [Pseudomonadota bacterium]
MATATLTDRRTSADVVFEDLYDQIISLRLLPGTKISEAEVADQFGVSRQPVRDAFNRLGNMRLLRIQPQRATLVQKFSLKAIEAARFVRLSVELEVVRVALARWSGDHAAAFEESLKAQEEGVAAGDALTFHSLDEGFHRLVADAADKPFAFDLIIRNKAMIDRICVLSLKQAREMDELVGDHRALYESIAAGDADAAEATLRLHLTRIEATIDAVRRAHADYFED